MGIRTPLPNLTTANPKTTVHTKHGPRNVAPPTGATMKSLKAVLTVLALITAANMARATEPVCKKTTTFETDAAGRTVIRVKSVCVVQESK
jgi:hypothetical protein